VSGVVGPGGNGVSQALVAGPAEGHGAALSGGAGDRSDAGLGGELAFGGEALGVIAELGEDLGSVDLSGAWEGHDELACGQLSHGVLDRGGQPPDAVDERGEDADEVEHGFAFGLLLQRSGQAGGCRAEAFEQLGRVTASGVAVAGEEARQALGAEASSPPRRGIAFEEGEGDRRVDVGEDDGRTGPEALEQSSELVGERDALGDEIVPATHQRPQGSDLVGERLERAEAVAIGAQDVGEDVGIAGVALAAGGPVARPARLELVGMDRHDRMAGVDEGVDDEAAGPLDGYGKLLRWRDAREPRVQSFEPFGGVLDVEPGDDRPAPVDHAGSVHRTAPVQAHGVLAVHRLPPSSDKVSGAGRPCRSLTGRRSGGCVSNALRPVARHPVAGLGLPVSARRRVSSGLSSSKRTWPSSQRHRRGGAAARCSRSPAPTRKKVQQ